MIEQLTNKSTSKTWVWDLSVEFSIGFSLIFSFSLSEFVILSLYCREDVPVTVVDPSSHRPEWPNSSSRRSTITRLISRNPFPSFRYFRCPSTEILLADSMACSFFQSSVDFSWSGNISVILLCLVVTCLCADLQGHCVPLFGGICTP